MVLNLLRLCLNLPLTATAAGLPPPSVYISVVSTRDAVLGCLRSWLFQHSMQQNNIILQLFVFVVWHFVCLT